MGFRHDRASAGRSHEPLARGAHGAGPARTVLAGLVAVATLATGGLVASTAYAGGAGDNRPGGATGGLPAGMVRPRTRTARRASRRWRPRTSVPA